MKPTLAGPLETSALPETVEAILNSTPLIDLHTHLYPPSFGTPFPGSGCRAADPAGLMLWGIDELITYHYLIAELFRVTPATPDRIAAFWKLGKPAQADLIWKHLFIERSPVSEACRGVVTTLQRLGLDPAERDLKSYRAFFAAQNPDSHLDRVMELAGVESITMTNAVFDDNERNRWLADPAVGRDPRFSAVLRFDPLLCDWPLAAGKLSDWGYAVGDLDTRKTIEEIRRFLREWFDRTGSIYAAVSLPPSYRFGSQDSGAWQAGNRVLTEAVLPVCRERNLPMALMIGAERGIHPALRDAGDMGFPADVRSLCELCAASPENRFLVTMLSRENQHELAVAARKFGNLMIFGCWWFLNNPSLIEQITRLRLELLGLSFVPQHSDCRVLEQLLYKWDHSKRILARVLSEKYTDLAASGWAVRPEEIARDVKRLLRDNFLDFLRGS